MPAQKEQSISFSDLVTTGSRLVVIPLGFKSTWFYTDAEQYIQRVSFEPFRRDECGGSSGLENLKKYYALRILDSVLLPLFAVLQFRCIASYSEKQSEIKLLFL